ncbi:MAG TPA: glycosyltransferase family 2 protein, partial [Candidatus Eisenbacteria bacterium]|nr:glycosyltransferase family 2 protein [Candidatus Eisenbacteria bacterium]
WAKRIVVIDSFSTDDTCDIARQRPRLTLFQRQFDNHTEQWNFGLKQVLTDWVLSLDADYVLTEEFISELSALRPEGGVSAYYAGFQYCIQGRPLRAALYPPRAVLFKRGACYYEQDGHTQLLRISGKTSSLATLICHDDRKSLSRWVSEQDRYAILEAKKLLRSTIQLRLQDRLRRNIVMAPVLVFLYTLFAKRLILDGWPGWYYAFQRTLAEVLLSLRLIEAKLKPPRDIIE